MTTDHNGYMAKAESWLELARKLAGTRNISSHIAYTKEYARKAGISLEDIGSGDNELTELLVKGYVAEAESWLELARKLADKRNIEPLIVYVNEYREKAGVSPERIGTSSEELDRLRNRYETV